MNNNDLSSTAASGRFGGGTSSLSTPSSYIPGLGGTPASSNLAMGQGGIGVGGTGAMPASATALGYDPNSNTNSSNGGGFNGQIQMNGFSNTNDKSPVPQTAQTLASGNTNGGPAIYGANGNQTLGQFQQWQADEFNKNQLAGQAQYNSALGAMPYNTQIGQTNPYDQYVANPATPGQASAAFQSPANLAAWQNSGLANQLSDDNPAKALGQPGAAFAGSQPQNPNYGNNQLLFLMNTLQRYGQGGQNRFGNRFSPIFTGGTNSQSNLNGLGNSSSNPGGYQSGNQGTNNFNINQLLPLLLGLSQQRPQAGSYGNIGVQNQ